MKNQEYMNSSQEIFPLLIEDLGMLYPTKKSKHKTRIGIYKCGFCGKEFKAITQSIKQEKTKSCGCLKGKGTTTIHGLSHTKLYSIWNGIMQRTTNPNHLWFKSYGGRGITICEEWKNDFIVFKEWSLENGYIDGEDLSIDRIDNDGNYEPSNCRWTTRSIQQRNKGTYKNNKTGLRGVRFLTNINKYQAGLNIESKYHYIGLFLTDLEAGQAYNDYILNNNLEGFILNSFN